MRAGWERAALREKMEHTTQHPSVPHPPSFPHLFIHLIAHHISRPLSASHACTSSPSAADMVSVIKQALSDLAAVLRDRSCARFPPGFSAVQVGIVALQHTTVAE